MRYIDIRLLLFCFCANVITLFFELITELIRMCVIKPHLILVLQENIAFRIVMITRVVFEFIEIIPFIFILKFHFIIFIFGAHSALWSIVRILILITKCLTPLFIYILNLIALSSSMISASIYNCIVSHIGIIKTISSIHCSLTTIWIVVKLKILVCVKYHYALLLIKRELFVSFLKLKVMLCS